MGCPMQIVESTRWGVRAARLSFREAAGGRTVTLFPMLHVGEPAFYAAVYGDAFSHDIVLIEGVNSPITKRITRSYRWLAGSAKLNLVIQPPYPPAGAPGTAIVHADLSPDEFRLGWLGVPLWLRLLAYVAAPCIGLKRRWFGTREKLAAGLTMDDAATQKELLSWSEETAFLDRAILQARDARLVERLGEQLKGAEPTTSIAVVYGAAHMRAVLRELTRRGYACVGAEWMTVFAIG